MINAIIIIMNQNDYEKATLAIYRAEKDNKLLYNKKEIMAKWRGEKRRKVMMVILFNQYVVIQTTKQYMTGQRSNVHPIIQYLQQQLKTSITLTPTTYNYNKIQLYTKAINLTLR